MLHPAYSLKDSGVYAEYNRENERKAFYEFVDNLPGGGRDVYIKKLRSMYLSLYGDYLLETGRSFFLDKTPRYYLIWKELQDIFPAAKFIVLNRNPLSVLYSILKTWNSERWYRLSEHNHDLISAIDNITSMINSAVGVHIKYENLVDDPSNELQKLSSYIGISFDERMLEYDRNEKWSYGDQEYIYSQSGGIILRLASGSFHRERGGRFRK